PAGETDREVRDGKHARFSPRKRPNARRNLQEKLRPTPAWGRCEAMLRLATAQLLDQPLQLGRAIHEVRLEILLQPLAHGIANRPRCLAIDRLAGVGITEVHNPSFRALRARPCCSEISPMQLIGARIVSRSSAGRMALR